MIHGGKTMEPILKLEHIQKYYGNEGNITKAMHSSEHGYGRQCAGFDQSILSGFGGRGNQSILVISPD